VLWAHGGDAGVQQVVQQRGGELPRGQVVQDVGLLDQGQQGRVRVGGVGGEQDRAPGGQAVPQRLRRRKEGG
jgi:hypothetical protein